MISKTLLAVSIETFDRVWITCSVERVCLLVSVFVFPSDQIIIINKTPIIRLTGFPIITLLSAVSILIPSGPGSRYHEPNMSATLTL